MAKKTGGTTGPQERTSTRARTAGRGTRTAPVGGGQRARGARGASGAEGLMEQARELGDTTADMARDAAAEAVELAADVAERGEESMNRVAGWVRENPWPTLLIGAGAAWLAIDAVRGREMETEMERRRAELDEGGRSRVRRSLSTVAGAGRGAASTVADVSRRSASTVADASRGAGEQVTGFVRENPMWAGLAALGIGLAVGLALPSTMPENRVLGDARDNVVRKARQVADSAAETVREVAKSAGRIAGAGSQEG